MDLRFLVFAQQGYFVVMINPTGSTTFGQEFTDAIAEDWGGKPFTDMIEGWKFALDSYPEVWPLPVLILCPSLILSSSPRSMQIVPWRLEQAGVDMQSSKAYHSLSLRSGYLTISNSWIQGHPEFGFNFKALVCHDGVSVLE